MPLSKELIEKIFDIIAPPTVNNLIPHNADINSNIKNPLEKSFDINELDKAIKHTRNTAPGIDNFTYSIIKNLPMTAKTLLLKIFNDWWLKGSYVKQFKEIVICLLLKPNKNNQLPSSYRPISLLSCLVKTFERMIKARLEWHVEHNSLLRAPQYGFRRGYGTVDAIAQLVTHAQCTFSDNKYLASIFIDLKGSI